MSRNAIGPVLVLALVATPLMAFDTGHHSDATRAALRKLNRITTHTAFSDQAIQIVQVSNWLTDYYTNTEKFDRDRKKALEKLHFDNLFTTKEVDRYWNRLAFNTKTEVERIARKVADHERQRKPELVRDDIREFLVVLGMTLHAVQDFYSHSNWVEEHPRPGNHVSRLDPYRTDTWYSSTLKNRNDGTMSVNDARTGLIISGFYPNSTTTRPPNGARNHGDYVGGMNHDSYVRPGWDEAYVFAYAGSVEWTKAVLMWAESAVPKFQGYLVQFQETPENVPLLDKDMRAAWNLSEWIALKPFEFDDGHWKGRNSGNQAWLAIAGPIWAGSTNSPYVKLFKNSSIAIDLSTKLYDTTVQVNPTRIAPVAFDEIAISVKTDGVKATSRDTPVKPRYYATIQFNALTDVETLVEATHEVRSSPTKEVATAWHSIYFAPSGAGVVKILYKLYNRDENTHKEYSIGSSSVNEAGLRFDLNTGDTTLSGDFRGKHAEPPDLIAYSGVSPQMLKQNFVAEVMFWAWSTPLQPAAGNGR